MLLVFIFGILASISVGFAIKSYLSYRVAIKPTIENKKVKNEKVYSLGKARIKRIQDIGKLLLEGVNDGLELKKEDDGMFVSYFVSYERFEVGVALSYTQCLVFFEPKPSEIHTQEEKEELKKQRIIIEPSGKDEDSYLKEERLILKLFEDLFAIERSLYEQKQGAKFLEDTSVIDFCSIPEFSETLKKKQLLDQKTKEINTIIGKN